MTTKTTAISIAIATVLIGGAIMLTGENSNPNNTGSTDNSNSQSSDNVSIADGKQVITIRAKGGYSPEATIAKSGLPTIIKIETQGTFDCSSALIIPSLGYRSNLPPSGETIIDVPSQKEGSTLKGLCSMGMYNFQIRFN